MVMRDSTNEFRYELVAEPGADTAPESPLRMLRRVLRGRYRLTAAMAMLFACAGGFAGWSFVQPTYEANGLVHVQGAVPSILYDTPENQAPPMFDSYLSSLVTYIKSPPVLEIANENPELRAIGWPEGAAGVAALQRTISVYRGKREQLIRISASTGDPQRSQVAANAVLAAVETYTAQPFVDTQQQLTTLREREAELVTRIGTLRDDILIASDQYGASAIQTMHTQKVRELVDLENRLAGVQIARVRFETGEVDPASDSVLNGSGAQDDRHLMELREEEALLVSELSTLSQKYGERHSLIRELRRKIEAVRIQIDIRSTNVGVIASSSSPNSTPLEKLDSLEERLLGMRERVRNEASALAVQVASINTLDAQIYETQDRLTETRTRIDQLAVESRRGDVDRVTVESWAMLPLGASKDRRSGLATAGAIGGFIAGVGFVFFLGLTDGRIRYIDELEALRLPAPLIGLLPAIGSSSHSEKQANRSVHQLRNLLELQMGDPSRNVYSITSSGHGDGKTSLAIGLARSFAAAGRRTLVIDGDIAGRRLTTELGLERASGLCESIGPDNRSGQVHLTNQPELWAMPVGSTVGINPEDLSRNRLVHLLDALRPRFDAIIIDTGPIRSSIEACLVSAVADRAVMVVSRHQTADRLRAAMDRLEQVGATCAGIVFNRTDQTDLIRRAEEFVPRTTTSERIISLAPPTATARSASVAPAPSHDELPFRLTDAPPVPPTASPPERKAA